MARVAGEESDWSTRVVCTAFPCWPVPANMRVPACEGRLRAFPDRRSLAVLLQETLSQIGSADGTPRPLDSRRRRAATTLTRPLCTVHSKLQRARIDLRRRDNRADLQRRLQRG